MELAYLGLFEKIFNWVLDKIFEPIFKWLSGLLNTVFTWIFNEILSPILLPVLEKALNFLLDLIMQIFGNIIYAIFAGILKLVDYMEIAFDVFIGIRDVTYYPDPTNTNVYTTGSLIEVLLQQETVSTIFWLITFAGLAIALMLTIFGTAKSSFDLDFENKRPVSKVLTEMMKAFIQFFTVPFFVYFMLRMAAEILKATTKAITGNISTTLGRIVFVIASLNAAKEPQYNANYTGKSPAPLKVFGTSPGDPIRFPFYIAESVDNVTPLDYSDIEVVKNSFDVLKFDYLIGALAAIFLLFVMAVCLITFVKRIFEIILLYMVSPYFVSTMPIDDGERFGRWRDMFIGKCFTGFGSAIGMRLYLTVCRMIMGNTIQFTSSKVGNSIEMDYIMKLFFLIGGAWAVFKSGPMITSLISAGAGGQEGMTQAAAGGALYAHTMGKVAAVGSSLGRRALASAFRGKSKESALANDKNAKNSDPAQKFNGAKNDKMSKANEAKKWKKGTVSADAKRSGITIGANRKPIDQKKVKPGRLAMSKDPKAMAAAKAAQNPWKSVTKPTGARAGKFALGATRKPSQNITIRRQNAAKEKKNFRLGSLLQSTYDANGNHKIRVLGFGVNRDASGNTMAFKMPILNMKLQKTDPGQSMKLARLHIPGITRIDSNVQGGKLQYSDISVLHGLARFHKDENGTNVRALGGLAKYRHDAEGSHSTFAGIHTHSFADGGIGVDIGKFYARSGPQGSSMGIGHSFAMKGNPETGKIQSFRLGQLDYSRTGIMKESPVETVGTVRVPGSIKVGGTTGSGGTTGTTGTTSSTSTGGSTIGPRPNRPAPTPASYAASKASTPTQQASAPNVTVSTQQTSAPSQASSSSGSTIGPRPNRPAPTPASYAASKASTPAQTSAPKVTVSTQQTSAPSQASSSSGSTIGPRPNRPAPTPASYAASKASTPTQTSAPKVTTPTQQTSTPKVSPSSSGSTIGPKPNRPAPTPASYAASKGAASTPNKKKPGDGTKTGGK